MEMTGRQQVGFGVVEVEMREWKGNIEMEGRGGRVAHARTPLLLDEGGTGHDLVRPGSPGKLVGERGKWGGERPSSVGERPLATRDRQGCDGSRPGCLRMRSHWGLSDRVCCVPRCTVLEQSILVCTKTALFNSSSSVGSGRSATSSSSKLQRQETNIPHTICAVKHRRRLDGVQAQVSQVLVVRD